MMMMTMIIIMKFQLGGNIKRILGQKDSVSCYKEGKPKEVETPRAKLLVLFYSLMSQSGSTTFCQNNMLLLYGLSLLFQIQSNLLIKLSYLKGTLMQI